MEIWKIRKIKVYTNKIAKIKIHTKKSWNQNITNFFCWCGRLCLFKRFIGRIKIFSLFVQWTRFRIWKWDFVFLVRNRKRNLITLMVSLIMKLKIGCCAKIFVTRFASKRFNFFVHNLDMPSEGISFCKWFAALIAFSIVFKNFGDSFVFSALKIEKIV